MEESRSRFRIEHIGISVSQPVEMANWYAAILGFEVRFAAQDSEKAVAFVNDAGGVTLEFGKLPGVKPLAEDRTHPLQLRLALKSDDPERDAERLVRNGREKQRRPRFF